MSDIRTEMEHLAAIKRAAFKKKRRKLGIILRQEQAQGVKKHERNVE